MTPKILKLTPLVLGAFVVGTAGASAQIRPVPPQPMTAPSSPMLTKSAMQGNSRLIPLSQIDNPKHVIAHANVVDRDGNAIGSVHDVRTNPDGTVSEIHVDLGNGEGGRLVALPPAGLRYERAGNELVTGFSKEEIRTLPMSNG